MLHWSLKWKNELSFWFDRRPIGNPLQHLPFFRVVQEASHSKIPLILAVLLHVENSERGRERGSDSSRVSQLIKPH